MGKEVSAATERGSALRDLLWQVRQYRMEVEPGNDDEREAAVELDHVLRAFDAWCPLHGGYDPDQRGPGWCPYCVAERGVLG